MGWDLGCCGFDSRKASGFAAARRYGNRSTPSSLSSADGFTPSTRWDALVYFNEVSDGYFATLGTRILTGRDFNGGDVVGGERVAITILGLVAEWIEFTMSGKYARKYGGSRRAGWGAMLGGVIGAVELSL